MEIKLRDKYLTHDHVYGYPAKARTGNSHGPAKGRTKRKDHGSQRPRVMVVDGMTGKHHMDFDGPEYGRPQ